MKNRILACVLSVAMCASLIVGCTSKEEPADTTTNEETTEESVPEETEEETTEEADYSNIAVEKATLELVEAYMTDGDENTILVDARAQEAYSGWALEGASNGGHLTNAVNFSARWLDCEYSDAAPREAYLRRSMKTQNITAGKEVIVYDYTGEQATPVAQYFIGNGIENVTVFQANELIDNESNVEHYENYNRFLPTETVKSISDVVTGKEDTLSDEAKAIVGKDTSNVVLVDVGWGNAFTSTYFSVGHVPGAVHINTDSYERPRVYVPEKRSQYAKEWRLISLEEFRDEVCTQYGITKDSIVILTGAANSPQARLGFMLRSVGVQTYAMSGCLTAWTYNGYEVDTDPSTLVVPTSVESFGSDTITNPDEILWTEDIKAILNGEVEGQVVDNRGEEEWLGEATGYSYHDLAGQIEGSFWCLQNDDTNGGFFQNVDYTPRTTEEYESYLTSKGLDTSKTMAFFCGDSWGAAMISYWCQSADINTVKEWGNGWIPFSNEGNEFIDHNGVKVHYDKYLDTLLDEEGNDVRDGVNILDTETK